MMTDQVELVEPAAPETSIEESAPAAVVQQDDPTKKLRDKLADQGRQLQETQRLLHATTAQITQLTQVVQQQGAALSATEQRRVDAYLNSIEDPGQRAMEEVKILKRQLQTAGPNRPVQQSPGPAPTPVQESAEEYQRRRTQEILDEINQKYGTTLTGTETDEDGDPILDHDSEAAFKASARAHAAALRKAAPQEAPVTKKTEAATSGSSAEPRLSSPAAPRPVARSQNGPVDAARLNQTIIDGATGRAGRKSPLAIQKELKALQEQAAAKLPK